MRPSQGGGKMSQPRGCPRGCDLWAEATVQEPLDSYVRPPRHCPSPGHTGHHRPAHGLVFAGTICVLQGAARPHREDAWRVGPEHHCMMGTWRPCELSGTCQGGYKKCTPVLCNLRKHQAKPNPAIV